MSPATQFMLHTDSDLPVRASATGTDVTVTSQLAHGDGQTESYVPTYQEGRQPSPKGITYQEGNARALLILHTGRNRDSILIDNAGSPVPAQCFNITLGRGCTTAVQEAMILYNWIYSFITRQFQHKRSQMSLKILYRDMRGRGGKNGFSLP